MEIDIQVQDGRKFSIEIDPSETILDLKEKVQDSQHITIARQTILFQTEYLEDYCTVSECNLHHGACIVLQVSPGPPPSPVSDSDLPPQPHPTPDLQLPILPSKEFDPSGIPPWDPSLQLVPPADLSDPLALPGSPSSLVVIPMPNPPSKLKEYLEESSASASASPSQPAPAPLPTRSPPPRPRSQIIPYRMPAPPPRVTFNVKVPRAQDRITIEMERVETVLKLREKIAAREEMRGAPIERIVLQSRVTRMELRDYQVLQNIIVSESPDVDVFLKPSMPIPGRRLKVKVIPMRSKHKVEIEVNSTDNVSVLREELERLHQLGGYFPLPEHGGYFFIYNHMNMEEHESFQWHQVKEGDTIETFDGFISSSAKASSALAAAAASAPSARPSEP